MRKFNHLSSFSDENGGASCLAILSRINFAGSASGAGGRGYFVEIISCVGINVRHGLVYHVEYVDSCGWTYENAIMFTCCTFGACGSTRQRNRPHR